MYCVAREIEQIFLLFACHFLGDYVLQSKFLAKTKGKNWYHLLVHSFLYAIPFWWCFGFDPRVWCLMISHIVIDAAKARYHILNYIADQLCHIVIMIIVYINFFI